MPRKRYKTGMKMHEWTLIEYASKGRWLCSCSCGEKHKVYTGHMNSGASTRCKKCYGKSKQTLKHKYPREHRSWHHMIQRCTNPNNDRYPRYGGAGIKVCDSWIESFDNFFEDMGPRPENTSIDRINNSKGYNKDNCRWATPSQQYNNMTSAITYKGEKMSRATFAKKFGVNPSTISHHLIKGKTTDEIAEYYKNKNAASNRRSI